MTTNSFKELFNTIPWKNIKHGSTFDSPITFESFVFIFIRIHWLLLSFMSCLCRGLVCFKRDPTLAGWVKTVPASYKYNITFIRKWLYAYHLVHRSFSFFILSRSLSTAPKGLFMWEPGRDNKRYHKNAVISSINLLLRSYEAWTIFIPPRLCRISLVHGRIPT